ncbi:hypothetical protein AMTRI_Chr11g153200 [Amborella trichopoda]
MLIWAARMPCRAKGSKIKNIIFLTGYTDTRRGLLYSRNPLARSLTSVFFLCSIFLRSISSLSSKHSPYVKAHLCNFSALHLSAHYLLSPSLRSISSRPHCARSLWSGKLLLSRFSKSAGLESAK